MKGKRKSHTSISRVMKTHRLAAALSVLPVLAMAQDLPVTFIEVDAVPGAHYGWGYNLTTQQFVSPCVTYNSNATYPSGEPVQNTAYELTENTATIVSKSNLTVSAALKILSGITTYGANSKSSVAGGSESSVYNQTLFATAWRYDVPQFLDIAQVSIKQDIAQMLATPGGQGQFKQQCGDGFVIGVQVGREFVGTASVTKQDLKSWTKFANETGLSAKDITGSAQVDLNLAREMERAFGSQNIKVQTYSTGSDIPNPTKVTELQTYYQQFLNKSGPKKTVKLIVAPYSVLGNYPWENPLRGMEKDDYIGMMVVALWELRSALRDADFVLNPETRPMFALGSDGATRDRRLVYIKKQREQWQREYDLLLSAAQQCDRQFTDRCKNLAEFYDRQRNLTQQRYMVLPERYLSDCYQHRTIASWDNLKNSLQSRNFGTPVKGDGETAGNPSRVVALLRFKPDQRQLKTELSVAKIEWKQPYHSGQPLDSTESTWALQAQAVVFDLDRPAQFGLEPDNLRHCTYRGVGVTTQRLTPPAAMSELQRFGFTGQVAHGMIDGLTGRDPRDQQYFGNGRGVLEYITCEVDRKGNDNNMQCLDLGLRSVSLDLLSNQDVAADAWADPPSPQIPGMLLAFHNLPEVAPLVGVLKAVRLTPAQQQAVDRAEAQKREAQRLFKKPVYQLPSTQLQNQRERIQIQSPRLLPRM